jgi:hypothetical protein
MPASSILPATWLVLAIMMTSCSIDDNTPVCRPATIDTTCLCTTGAAGLRTCLDDGLGYGDCECVPDGGAGDADASVPADASPGDGSPPSPLPNVAPADASTGDSGPPDAFPSMPAARSAANRLPAALLVSRPVTRILVPARGTNLAPHHEPVEQVLERAPHPMECNLPSRNAARCCGVSRPRGASGIRL